MQLTPENVLTYEHGQWLNHPVTIQLIKNLEKFKQSFNEANQRFASDFEKPDLYFRNNAMASRTIESLIIGVKDTTKFIEQSEKK